jgi:T5SS/PEP-CTERM-associated repeat protein
MPAKLPAMRFSAVSHAGEQHDHLSSNIMTNPPPLLTTLVLLSWPLAASAQLVADGGTAIFAAASTNITGRLTIGTNGSFTSLIITNAGAVTNSGSFSDSYIGFNATSKSNQVIVTGINSIWKCGLILYAGYQGSYNLLLIANGGKVHEDSGYLGVGGGMSNLAVITGTGSLWTNNNYFEVGGSGAYNTVLITNGGHVDTDRTFIGNAGNVNRVLITGTNSCLQHHVTGGPGHLWVGNSGGSSNQLVVANGGRVVDNSGYIGGDADSRNNLAIVSGAGSSWTNDSSLRVGWRGSASQLIVTNGGTVGSSDAYLGGDLSSSNNLALITGTNSQWSSLSDLYVGNVGSFNQLIVTNAGRVRAGNLYVGFDPASSNNTVTVAGGTLTCEATCDIRRGALILNSGSLSAYSMDLTNGAQSQFSFNGGTLRTTFTTNNSGSVFSVGDGISPAMFELYLTGTHHFFNHLRIANKALLKGRGTIIGNVTNTAGGTLSPGEDVGYVRTLTIISNLVLATGSTNVFEIRKISQANDSIVGLASVTYGGWLVVTNLSGTLAADDAFKLFSATTYNGYFAGITPQWPGPGLKWNTNGLAVDGTLRVAAITSAPPAISSSAILNGTNLALSATGGVPFDPVYLLTTINVTLPPINWSRVATNYFDAAGNASFTNTITPGESQRYFRLQVL